VRRLSEHRRGDPEGGAGELTMHPFEYMRVRETRNAIDAGGGRDARFVAGGTSILDLMKLGVETPSRVVDINALPYRQIEEEEHGLSIGALAKNSDVAEHPLVKSRYPALSQALLSGASPQLRNMASMSGNLLQRTRCPYFRNMNEACNKRKPGSGCAARDGFNRVHAILGASEACIAVHPSDLCVALVALEATVHTERLAGPRAIPMGEFHRLPGDRPELENTLEPGEVITRITLPAKAYFARSRYLKVRDRASFAFALASAAVALDVVDGTVREARIAVGGVATKPWRCAEAEQALAGQPVGPALFERAAAVCMQHAEARKHNAFKVPLLKNTLVRALSQVAGLA
jgi:xanthine dehydrogenase YagS FAD-binding subunit